MLFKLSDHISNCLERAALAEQRAQDVIEPAIRNDYERLAQSWRQLAASYQFVESLERFISDSDKVSATQDLICIEQPPSTETRQIIRRPRVKHELSFRDRLSKAAQEARAQAAKLLPGSERENLLMKVKQCEVALEVEEWVGSPGSAPPEQLDLTKTKR